MQKSYKKFPAKLINKSHDFLQSFFSRSLSTSDDYSQPLALSEWQIFPAARLQRVATISIQSIAFSE
jgi:hypothetical protein